jgi:PadR family transcriptional regulator, regulatory protein PadR
MRDCEPRNFVQPCLLLLLAESPEHGYGLLDRLRLLCGSDNDASGVYRALRNLEHQGLVCSSWSTSTPGPARRMYRLTPQGSEALAESVDSLRVTRSAIDAVLSRHARVRAAGPVVRAAPIYRI